MHLIDRVIVVAMRHLPFGYHKFAKAMVRIRPSLRHCKVDTKYGPLTCDISERVCVPLVREGGYPNWKDDEAVIASIPLSQESVVVDIGANVGATVALFAERAGIVHAFEPAPRALKLLRGNKQWTNVEIHPVALGPQNGSAFLSETEDLDVSHIAKSGAGVTMRTLDSFGLKPDLIKLDVEGFEPQVLEGAMETLKHGPLILFEALSEESRKACEHAITKANACYRFRRVSSLNFLATPDWVEGAKND